MSARMKFQMLENELEEQPEFNNFEDRLRTFELRIGKVSEAKNKLVGQFKVYIQDNSPFDILMILSCLNKESRMCKIFVWKVKKFMA